MRRALAHNGPDAKEKEVHRTKAFAFPYSYYTHALRSHYRYIRMDTYRTERRRENERERDTWRIVFCFDRDVVFFRRRKMPGHCFALPSVMRSSLLFFDAGEWRVASLISMVWVRDLLERGSNSCFAVFCCTLFRENFYVYFYVYFYERVVISTAFFFFFKVKHVKANSLWHSLIMYDHLKYFFVPLWNTIDVHSVIAK